MGIRETEAAITQFYGGNRIQIATEMAFSQFKSMRQATDTAVLLVLLPVATGEGQPQQSSTKTSLDYLQNRLGTAIRVLKIDEASHFAVVRSFQATELPAFVLVRQGIELWRQPGLPEGDAIVSQLLSKVNSEDAVTQS